MACIVCKNPDGPCVPKTRDFSFFMVAVPTYYENSMAIPCYAREKVNTITQGMKHLEAELSNGVAYSFILQKLATVTCITGNGWYFFQRDFKIKPGDVVLFEFSKDGVSPIKIVAYDKDLKIKPYIFMEDTSSGSSDEQDVTEKVYKEHNVVILTRNLVMTDENVANWEAVVGRRGKGIGPLFVHKLTETNVKKNQLKIPIKIVQALNLYIDGVAVLKADGMEDVQGAYSTCSDGRMSIDLDAWKEVVSKTGLVEGQVVMFLFHRYGDILTYRSGVVISVDVI